MNYQDHLQRIYVLSINYRSFEGEYLWISAFSASLRDKNLVAGKLIDLYFPPGEDFFHLILGHLGNNEKYPTKIKSFRIDKSGELISDKITLRVIYDQEKNDFYLLLDKNTRLESPYLGNDVYFPGKDLPIVSYTFHEINLVWIIDGTMSEDMFSLVKNIALLLTRKLEKFSNLQVGFIVFGEYERLWKAKNNQLPIPNIFEKRPDNLVLVPPIEFVRQLQKAEPISHLQWDDPAAAVELAIKEVADNSCLSSNTESWIIIAGDSLPHFSIKELLERNVEVVPTEEFLNISWKQEFRKLLDNPNLKMISCWVDDPLNQKWLSVPKDVASREYLNARNWWTSELPSHFPSIQIEADFSAMAIMQDIYDIMFHASNPYFYLAEKLRLPLKQRLHTDHPNF